MTEHYRLHLESGQILDGSAPLRELLVTLADVYDEVAEQWEVPSIEVTVVVTDDFHAEVDRALAMRESPAVADGPYDSLRLGGVAVAKNIFLTSDASRVRIVVNSAGLGRADDAPGNLWTVFLIAHEFAHPILERRRRADSVAEDEVPRTSAHAAARAIVRTALDELNADLLANIVLGTFGSVSIDGQKPRPVKVTDLVVGHGAQVARVLDDHVYPGWADLVDSYRTRKIGLDDLWRRIGSETDQVMTLLGHAEAEARCLERPGPLEAECAEHSGARLYLADAWRRIMNAYDDFDDSADPDIIRGQRKVLLAEGESALVELWKKLGLTFSRIGDDGLYIGVDEPMR